MKGKEEDGSGRYRAEAALPTAAQEGMWSNNAPS